MSRAAGARGKVCPELVGLSGPFTKIARAMSSQWNVRIIPSGSECKTDGKTIKIPFTSDLLPADRRQILHGMLDHEICHVAEEQRHEAARRPTPIKLLNDTKDKKLRLMINIFEDIRIEQRYEAIYPGMAQNIRAVNVDSAKEWSDGHEERTAKNFWGTFGAAIILRARHLEDAWTYEGEIGEWMALIEEEIAESQRGGEWVDTAIALAKRVLEKVKQKHEEQKEKDKTKEKDPELSGDGGEGDEGGDPSDDDGDEAESKKPTTGTPDDDPDFDDFAEKGRVDMSDYVIADARTFDRYIPHPNSLALDSVQDAPDLGVAEYDTAKAEVMAQIQGLKSKQRMVIMSWSRRRVLTGLESGQVDDDALTEVRTGNRNAFTDITKKRSLNTAITGVVDCSGSMESNQHPGCCAYYALRTAIALAESWMSLGVPNEWLGFTVRDYQHVPLTHEDVRGPFICRAPLHHMVFKGFDTPLKGVRGRFMSIQGHGSNVDGESVAWAARRLAARPEKRKILVVISDGRPATMAAGKSFHETWRILQDHLRYVVKSITSSGIEVIGIGAGTAEPAAYYNDETGAKFVHVENVHTMAVDIYRVMKARVTKGAA